MAHLDWLYRIFESHSANPCLSSGDQTFTYKWLLETVSSWQVYLDEAKLQPGSVVALEGDFSPQMIAALLALIDRSAIVVPLSPSAELQQQEFMEIAEVQVAIRPSLSGGQKLQRLHRVPANPLNLQLLASGNPGLVLFSSGSTGKSKAALHDFIPLLEKFKAPRRAMVILTFLMIDHIGGINTLFYVLS